MTRSAQVCFGFFLHLWCGIAALCTTETFDFNDGTFQGWSIEGSASLSGSSVVINEAGPGPSGIEIIFDAGVSLELSYTWSASSTFGYTTNQYSKVTGITGDTVGGTGYCGNCLYSCCSSEGNSASGYFTQIWSSTSEPLLPTGALAVWIGLYDSWSSGWSQTNTVDNIDVTI